MPQDILTLSEAATAIGNSIQHYFSRILPPSLHKEWRDRYALYEALDTEHEFLPPRNKRLDAYWKNKHVATPVLIDLASGSSGLPPHAETTRAAEKAVSVASAYIYKNYAALTLEVAELLSRKNLIEQKIMESLIAPLDSLLTKFDNAPEDFDINSFPFKGKLHPLVEAYVSTPKSERIKPTDWWKRKDIGDIQDSLILVVHAKEMVELYGTPPGIKPAKLGINARTQELMEQMATVLNEIIPSGVIERNSKDMINNRLTPAVVKHLQSYHGINVADPDTICYAPVSSFNIMDACLQTLKPEAPKSFIQSITSSRKPSKALVVFSHSWDGLPYLAASCSEGNLSIIQGEVSAEALEKYIIKTILKNDERLINNAEKAREAVAHHISALVLNIPEIPSGKIVQDEELAALAAIIKKYDIKHVLLDELFALPGTRSLASLEGMTERCFVVGSTSKIFNETSPLERVAFGYTANKDWAAKTEAILRQNRSAPAEAKLEPTLALRAAVRLDMTPDSYPMGNEKIFAKRAAFVTEKTAGKRAFLAYHAAARLPGRGCFSRGCTCPRRHRKQLSAFRISLQDVMGQNRRDHPCNAHEERKPYWRQNQLHER